MIDEAEHARLAPIAQKLQAAIKACEVPEPDLSDLLVAEGVFIASKLYGARKVAHHLYVLAHAIALDADRLDADAMLEKTLSGWPH